MSGGDVPRLKVVPKTTVKDWRKRELKYNIRLLKSALKVLEKELKER
jgi:hypothetical protein